MTELSKRGFSASQKVTFRIAAGFYVGFTATKPYRPDLLHFSFLWKEKLRFGSVKPSPATVHRTVAFRSSNLARSAKKEAHLLVCFFFVLKQHFRCSFFQLLLSQKSRKKLHLSFASFDKIQFYSSKLSFCKFSFDFQSGIYCDFIIRLRINLMDYNFLCGFFIKQNCTRISKPNIIKLVCSDLLCFRKESS